MSYFQQIPGSYDVLLTANDAFSEGGVPNTRVQDAFIDAYGVVGSEYHVFAGIIGQVAALRLLSDDRWVLENLLVPTVRLFGKGLRCFSIEELSEATTKLTILQNVITVGTAVAIHPDDLPLKCDDDGEEDYLRPRKDSEWSAEISGVMKRVNAFLVGQALKGVLSFDHLERTTASVLTGLEPEGEVMKLTKDFVDVEGVPIGLLVRAKSPLELIAAGVCDQVYPAISQNLQSLNIA